MPAKKLVVRDADGFPVDVILYPQDDFEPMFVPDQVWAHGSDSTVGA